ncbi:MAG TPA: peptidoglycan DD-metalloendopeptidase family protein [Candidatus Paceibacterota bacterium]
MGKLSAIAFICVFAVFASSASAQTAGEIQKQIDENNAQIQQLDNEIANYQAQLDSTTKQKDTLQNTVNQLSLQGKQLTAKINVTKSQIKTTQLQIQQLSQGIATKQATIDGERAGLAESLRSLDAIEQTPLSMTLLAAGTISDVWQDIDSIGSLQGAMQATIVRLAADKQTLTDNKTTAEAKRAQLLKQQATLNTQQGSLNATKKAQSDLLAQTKNQESNYQKVIADKIAAKQDFEDTLRELQAKLQSADTSAIPTQGKGVLRWPLTAVHVTQYFGDTAFARTAAYKGKGHNGIDLRASIGTPTNAALGGVVQETNLGTAPNCQYGKWVLIRHNNGLTTLYAHLSGVNVVQGQSVSTGQLIGYTGNTGYATGPHLHFTVYVSSAVSFINYKCNSGKSVRAPVSPFNGYVNPLVYLP